jgi:hypothetical protein
MGKIRETGKAIGQGKTYSTDEIKTPRNRGIEEYLRPIDRHGLAK